MPKALKRADSFEYWRKLMTPVGSRDTRHQATTAQMAPIPSIPVLTPDRCFLPKVEAPESACPRSEIKLSLKVFEGQRETKLSTEWTASTKLIASIGILDLPKEIRDMIYGEICGSLKRAGLRWEATAPHTSRQPHRNDVGKSVAATTDEPREQNSEARGFAESQVVFADCAIMRTCRQVHAEFASVLYANPLQLLNISSVNSVIPLSSTYASLVREILYASTCPHKDNSTVAWRNQLQVVTRLSKMFPQANTIRLALYICICKDFVAGSARRNPQLWDQNVAKVQGAIKAAKMLSDYPIAIPHNLEAVQLKLTNEKGSRPRSGGYDEVESVLTPVTEAIAGVRAKKRASKGKKGTV